MKNSGIDPKTCLPDEAKFEAFMLQYRQRKHKPETENKGSSPYDGIYDRAK